jgi:hypothetical protein
MGRARVGEVAKGIPMPPAVPETVDDILAEATALPLADAAYALWRQR